MSSIPLHIKIQDEEWKKWKVKKIVEHKKILSNFPFNYKRKNQSHSSRSKEVLVKITSNSKNFQSLSKHIDYISRNGKLEILTSDMETYLGKEEIFEVKKTFRYYGKTIPDETLSKEIRQTYNIVFSMKEYSNTPPEKLKIAVFDTLKSLYPDNFFALALHTDTDNPHCHICLKISKNDGKKIDIRKSDLARLRQNFAKNLNELGVEAKATSRKQEISIDIAKRQRILDELRNKNPQKVKSHHYKVLDFGVANFEFKEYNKPSFYVKYATSKGEGLIWGVDLERLIKQKQIQKGEYVRFVKIGFKAENYSFKKKIENQWCEIETIKKIPVWDASISGRDEKSKFDKLSPIKEYYNIKPLKKEINERRYTSEEWARYYAQQRIYKSNITFNRTRKTTKSINDLSKLSQINMVSKSQSTQMLLHSNALNQLEYRGKRQSDKNVRWTNNRDNGITRDKD